MPRKIPKILMLSFALMFLGCGMILYPRECQAQPFAVFFDLNQGKPFNTDDPMNFFVIQPLTCEQNPGGTCAVNTMTNFNEIQVTDTQAIISEDDRVCEGHSDPVTGQFVEESCISSTNDVYLADIIPGLETDLGQVASVAIAQHDPITCQNLTGRFADLACCNGAQSPDGACVQEFNLDYRCESTGDFSSISDLSAPQPKSIYSSYVISRGK